MPHIILQNLGGPRFLLFLDGYNPGNKVREAAHDTILRRWGGFVKELALRSSLCPPSKRDGTLSMGGACGVYLCGEAGIFNLGQSNGITSRWLEKESLQVKWRFFGP